MRRRTAEPKGTKIHQEACTTIVRTHASEPSVRAQLSWWGRRGRYLIEVSEQVRDERPSCCARGWAETQPLGFAKEQAALRRAAMLVAGASATCSGHPGWRRAPPGAEDTGPSLRRSVRLNIQVDWRLPAPIEIAGPAPPAPCRISPSFGRSKRSRSAIAPTLSATTFLQRNRLRSALLRNGAARARTASTSSTPRRLGVALS